MTLADTPMQALLPRDLYLFVVTSWNL